ncbi:HAMP domain-containing sensor histidine kinase [uncultured Roseibium sp.]|uniref:sensor histidine kinase n=1 Tax=uncultured Roseibium sp. TaxID=1936171 RepID=UPI0026090529|nr:HAMP domain-containing sensor histidine kinase [uncultured Roseibium sp.]
MTRRSDLVAYIVAGTASVAFALLLVFSLARLLDTEAELRRNEGDNMLWAISRTQSAALLLDAEVSRHVGTISRKATELDKRYNVMLSRLNLLSEGPQRRYMRELGLDGELEKVAGSLRALEARILDMSYGDVQTASAVHDLLQPLIEDLGRAGNQSMVRQWEATGARLDNQRAAIVQVIISIVAIIVLGAFLSFTMLRAMAEQQRIRLSLLRERETAEIYRSFVALVSHQFRTPLAVIDSAMQRVLRSGNQMPTEEIRQRASQVRSEVRGLTRLLEATLDVVRLEERQVTARPGNCHVEDLIQRVVARQSEETPERAFSLEIGNKVPQTIETDRLLAEQILDNLLSNAVKYSPVTEPVSVSVRAQNRSIFISVHDRGVGIPPEEQERVFSRFFRGNGTAGIPGTGIGLNISSQVARLLGGELSFESQAGIGSAFTLKLPEKWPGIQ